MKTKEQKSYDCVGCGKDVRRTWVWIKISGKDFCGDCAIIERDKAKK